MAIGAFVEGGGSGYSGRVTPFVVLSCIVAGSGGILFGYDLGISGISASPLSPDRFFIHHQLTITPSPRSIYLYSSTYLRAGTEGVSS